MRKSPACWTFVRSGEAAFEAADFVQASRAVATSIPPRGSATLLAMRSEGELAQFLLSDSEALARAVAAPIGAEARPAQVDGAALSVRHVAHMVYQRRSVLMTRSNVVGVDPAVVASTLTRVMGEGTWIAVRMRRALPRERRRQHAWISHFLGTTASTHYSTREGDLVISIDVGAPTRDQARDLVDGAHSAIPGFDVEVRARQPQWWPSVLGGVLAGAVAALAALAVSAVPRLAAPALLAAGLVAGVAWGVRTWRGHPLGAREVLRLITARPPTRTAPPRKPTAPSDGDPGRPGAYPLDLSTFLIAPDMVIGLVAPQAGALTGRTSTRERSVPTAFTRPIGPFIGTGSRGAPAHIDVSSGWDGVFVVGRAGSGKSQLVRSLFAWHLMEHMSPSDTVGTPGRANTLIAFENKGEGVEQYEAWGRALGAAEDSEVHVIDVADVSTPAVDMVGTRGTVAERAQHFVDAMQFGFAEGSIVYRSAETLRQVITGALALTPAMVEAVGLPAGGSFLDHAHVLLGAYGDDMGVALAGEIRSEAVRLEAAGTPDADLSLARDALAPLYGGATPAQRRPFLEAPRNKVDALLRLRAWWSPQRPRLTWDEILTSHCVVVVNMGTSRTGEVIDGEATAALAGMVMFLLRRSIQMRCSGWQALGRWVTIFADELSLLSGSSPEVIEWLHEAGRSFGVRPVFATQFAEQLNPRLVTSVLGYGTILAFQQGNITVADGLAANFAASGDPWTGQDIYNLPRYTAVCRGYVEGQPQPPFTVALRNFEADRASFPFIQRDPSLQRGDDDHAGTPGAAAIAPAPAQGPARPTLFGEER